MCKNVIVRRLIFNKQFNLLLIILLILIYFSIDLIEIGQKKKSKLFQNVSEVLICPKSLNGSKGYINVDLIESGLRNRSSKCGKDDILLIYILSTAKNVQRRQLIRQSWARKKDYSKLNQTCFLFIVGKSIFDLNSKFSEDIKRENELNNDIIELNLNETYENVVYKEVGAVKWSYYYASKIPFLFKTDDDLILDSLLLSDVVKYFLQNQIDQNNYLTKHNKTKLFVEQMLNVDKESLFVGKPIGEVEARRTGKFRIHPLAWNHHKLPPYCSGFGYLYSAFVRDRLYRASLCYNREYVPNVGDVFLTGFLSGIGLVRCSGWPLGYTQTDEDCSLAFQKRPDLLVCSTPLHIGQMNYTHFSRSWNIIHQRHFNTTFLFS